MGADFFYYALTWLKDQKLDWEAGKAHIRKLAEDYKKEAEGGHRPTLGENYEDPEDEGERPVLTDSGCDYTVSDMELSLEDIQSGIAGSRRDCNVCQLGHLQILLTGGMSWGDDPTDLCHAMQAVLDCDGLAQAIGFNQFEYDYKAMVDKIVEIPAVLPMILHLDDDLDKLIEPKLKENA